MGKKTTSRDHEQTTCFALDEALARLRKDVVTGFASNYCVASRPALEVVLAHLGASPEPWPRKSTDGEKA